MIKKTVTCSRASTVVNQTAGLTDRKTFSLPVKGLKPQLLKCQVFPRQVFLSTQEWKTNIKMGAFDCYSLFLYAPCTNIAHICSELLKIFWVLVVLFSPGIQTQVK